MNKKPVIPAKAGVCNMGIKLIRIIALCGFVFNALGANMFIENSFAITPNIPASGINVANVEIPLSFGEIKDRIQGDNDNTVIHIQDAHCNYSAQHSIANIIRHISENYNVKLVMIEGGKGNYDLSVFTKIKDLDIRNKVSDYFVKEGRASGAEFFAINNPGKTTLFGVEDEKLYMANLNAYKESLEFKREADECLDVLTHNINNLKREIYSSELIKLDETIKAYKEKGTNFKEYVTTLSDKAVSGQIKLASFENITSLADILKQEDRIDFKEANRERAILVGKLESKLSRFELEHLVKMTVDFKKENITSEDFYGYLLKKASFVNVDFTSLPNLVKYSEYVKEYEKIDKAGLFKEIKILEDALMRNLLKTDDQKTLYTLDKNLRIMKDLLNISLIKEDYDYYQANKRDFNIQNFLNFFSRYPKARTASSVILRPKAEESHKNLTNLDSFRKEMGKFYAYSLKRDDAFMKNIQSKLKEENKKVTILVTGGFHAGNLKAIFKDKGYSYIEVMPKMDTSDMENNPYFHLLSGGKSQMEQIVETSILNSNIATPHILSEMGITGSRSGRNLYELSVDVRTALETDPQNGIILMVPGGYLRLTHEKPKSEFYEQVGMIDDKPVYAVREGNETYDPNLENMFVVNFDRDKLTYEGHQAVSDLMLKMAHAPNKTYAGLEAHSLKDFLIVGTKFCNTLITKIGGDNVAKLMDICDCKFGESKRFINVITSKDKTRVPWHIGSYSDNYGVNVTYTGNDQKFIEYLFHELNRAANSRLEHMDNNVVLEKEVVAFMLKKIEARLDTRGDFGMAEMPKMLKVSDDIALLPKEGLELFEKFYHYLMRPKFEPNVELNLDKLSKILKIGEADKEAFKVWVEVLKNRTATIWGLHPFGFLPNSTAQDYAIEMLVEYERYERFKRTDFAAAEMPSFPYDDGRVHIRRTNALGFDYSDEEITKVLKKTLSSEWKRIEPSLGVGTTATLIFSDNRKFSVEFLREWGRTDILFTIPNPSLRFSGNRLRGSDNVASGYIEISTKAPSRGDFAASEMPEAPVLLKDETRERILARISGRIPEILDDSFDVVNVLKEHPILKEKTLNAINDEELYTLVIDKISEKNRDDLSGTSELESAVRGLLLDERMRALSGYVKFYAVPGKYNDEVRIVVQNPSDAKDSIEFVLGMGQLFKDIPKKMMLAVLRGMPDERTSGQEVFSHILQSSKIGSGYSLKNNSIYIPRKQILLVQLTKIPDLRKAMKTVDGLLRNWLKLDRGDFAMAEMPEGPTITGDVDSGIHIDGKLQPMSLATDQEKEQMREMLFKVLNEAFKASTQNLFEGGPLMISLPINSEVSGVNIEEFSKYMANVQGVRVEAGKKSIEFNVGNVTYYLFEDNPDGREKLLTKLNEKQAKWGVSNEEMARRSIVYSFAKEISGITEKAFTVYLEGEIKEGAYRTPTPLVRCIVASVKVFNFFDLTRPGKKTIEDDINAAREDAVRGIISISGLSSDQMRDLITDLVEKVKKVGLFALSGKLFIKIQPVNWNDFITFHEIEAEVLRAV